MVCVQTVSCRPGRGLIQPVVVLGGRCDLQLLEYGSGRETADAAWFGNSRAAGAKNANLILGI